MVADQPLLVSYRPALLAFAETYGYGVTADEALPEAVAAAINTLLGDPVLGKRLGAAGEGAFGEEFNWVRQLALEEHQSLCGDMGKTAREDWYAPFYCY